MRAALLLVATQGALSSDSVAASRFRTRIAIPHPFDQGENIRAYLLGSEPPRRDNFDKAGRPFRRRTYYVGDLTHSPSHLCHANRHLNYHFNAS
jgi:hypothetical protein